MANTALEEAFANVGGQSALAKLMNLSRQTVNDWKRSGLVPIRHAPKVEEVTGVSRDRLCPDFPWTSKRRRQQRTSGAAAAESISISPNKTPTQEA